MDILDKVLESAKYVSDNSKYVSINYDKLDEIIEEGIFVKGKYWLSSNPYGVLDLSPREIINFLLILHAIGDFCFWGEPKWEINTEDGKLDGTYAAIYIILKRFKEKKSFDMSMLTFSTFIDGNVEIPLLGERYRALCEVNRYLKRIGMDFYDAIKDINDDKTLVKYLIDNFYFLRDISDFNGEKIYFYKRAQLLASDLLYIKQEIEHKDVDKSNLVGCADYKIPQVLRCFDVLEFSDELAFLVDEKRQIPEGSQMEIEIRANDLVVIDYVYKKLNGQVSRMDINDCIWLMGQDKSKVTKPYHRTLTIHY